MRDGAEGAATAAAMDLLIRYGDALGCDRLCDVRNVAGTMTQPSPVKERLVREGGWDKAFAVINLDCDTDIEVPAMRESLALCPLCDGSAPRGAGEGRRPLCRADGRRSRRQATDHLSEHRSDHGRSVRGRA